MHRAIKLYILIQHIYKYPDPFWHYIVFTPHHLYCCGFALCSTKVCPSPLQNLFSAGNQYEQM